MNSLPIPPIPGMPPGVMPPGVMPPGMDAGMDENPAVKKMCLAEKTNDVNEEWETELKDKMPQEIEEIMDAMCQRLSKDGVLNTCDADAEDTVKLVDYMTNEAEKLIRNFISGDETKISHYLLHYVPTLPKPMQSGGFGLGNMFKSNPEKDKAKYIKDQQDKAIREYHSGRVLTHMDKEDLAQGVPYDKIFPPLTKKEEEEYLKKMGKDTASLEKEFNEKNNSVDSKATSSSVTNPLESFKPSMPGATDVDSLTSSAENPLESFKPSMPGATDVDSLTSGAENPLESFKPSMPGATDVDSLTSGAENPLESFKPSMPGATDVDSLASGAENPLESFKSSMPDATNVGSLASGDTNIAAPKKTTKNEIEDGDAKTILKYYTSHFIKLLKCDSNTAELLKTKIIDSIFISINDKLKIDKQELFGSIAKETTKHCIEKRISLIKPTIEVYQNIISTAPEPEKILPNYLRLILELFVYNHYNDLLDSEKLTLTTVELSTHINTIKKINGFTGENDKLKVDSIVEIIDLNKVPSPKTEKKDTEEEEEETNNNEEALKQFKKLFEESQEKMGGKKKHTRKKKRHHKKRRSTRRYR